MRKHSLSFSFLSFLESLTVLLMGKIPVGGGWSEILANDSLSSPKVLSFSGPTVDRFRKGHYAVDHCQLFTPDVDGGVNDPLPYILHPRLSCMIKVILDGG